MRVADDGIKSVGITQSGNYTRTWQGDRTYAIADSFDSGPFQIPCSWTLNHYRCDWLTPIIHHYRVCTAWETTMRSAMIFLAVLAIQLALRASIMSIRFQGIAQTLAKRLFIILGGLMIGLSLFHWCSQSAGRHWCNDWRCSATKSDRYKGLLSLESSSSLRVPLLTINTTATGQYRLR